MDENQQFMFFSAYEKESSTILSEQEKQYFAENGDIKSYKTSIKILLHTPEIKHSYKLFKNLLTKELERSNQSLLLTIMANISIKNGSIEEYEEYERNILNNSYLTRYNQYINLFNKQDFDQMCESEECCETLITKAQNKKIHKLMTV